MDGDEPSSRPEREPVPAPDDENDDQAPSASSSSERRSTPAMPATQAAEPEASAGGSIDRQTTRLHTLLLRDIVRAGRVCLLACLLLGAFEYLAALLTSPAHDIRAGAALRLILLDLSLILLLWLMLAPALGALAAGTRLALRLRAPDRARRWPGLLAPPRPGFQPAAPWIWALFLGALLYVAFSTYLTFRAVTWFKEPQLTALVLALGQLALLAVAGGVAYLSGSILHRLAAALQRRLRRRQGLGRALAELDPLGRVGPALVLVSLCLLPALGLAALIMPQLEPLVPWRHLLALVVLVAGLHLGALLDGRRRRHRRAPGRQGLRRAGLPLLAVALVLLTLVRIGADHEAKSIATTGSPLLANLVDLVRRGTDFDRDGYGFLLGENDCAPFDRRIHPLARDIADNGIDEDCNGRDFSFAVPPSYKTGEQLPVPEDFRKDWNILLITVDTVRYDHTSFGGYPESKGRDTTPHLADLVERSISFDFAQAPSAGTMASVPAILTSKFFHSGIALDEKVKPRMPPKLMPQNLLISELLEAQGYYNGAILTHQYFNDWGMEQGFDTYDNELGETYQPARVTSQDVTDKAIAWIAHNSGRKWFLWTHYLDPHGYYVDHPGEKSFGTTEEDRYDGELHFTDAHIGRLLKAISGMPGAERTVVIITSDHGDGFNEHGFINHGMALYRELLHVPLIIHVPGVPPRRVGGAVSPLDIVPTVADLVGAAYDPAQFEGHSLVPQIFYGKQDLERVVFAETNWPKPLRAAVTSRYKLVYKLQSNIYELYDLHADPWEKRNIATRDEQGFATMKGYMDDWLERVYYARDQISNQAVAKLGDHLLEQAPTPGHPVQGVSFDDGRIEVLGFDADKDSYRPGDKMQVAVYFRVNERPSDDFVLQLEAWQPAAAPAKPGERRAPMRPARSKRRLTADGVLPTSRWRAGEYIRDRFTIPIPTSWRTGDTLHLGLSMAIFRGKGIFPAGPHRPDDPHTAVLGALGYQPRSPAAPDRPDQDGAQGGAAGKPGAKPAPAKAGSPAP